MHNSETAASGDQPGEPKTWRDLSRSTLTSQKVRNAMVELGWAYRPQKGNSGHSVFVRTAPGRCPECGTQLCRLAVEPNADAA
jgi:hypothetical protein